FQAEDGIRDSSVTGVQTCALPISSDVSVCSRAAGWSGPAPTRRGEQTETSDAKRQGRGSGEPRVTADLHKYTAGCNGTAPGKARSEERRVGKEGSDREWGEGEKER